MLGIIWGLNQKTANNRLQKLINDYALKDIGIRSEMTRISEKNYCTVVFTNGDAWRSFSAAENRRGARSNIALIDNRISKNFIDTVIMPCNSALPYRAYGYYAGEDYEEDVEMTEEEIASLEKDFKGELRYGKV